MDRLYAHVHLWAGVQHRPSYFDCYMMLSDWVLAVKGFDPFSSLRGTYGDPEICPVGRKYRNDPIPLGLELMQGLPIVETAVAGDVGFVRVVGQSFLSGAVRLRNTKSGRQQWAIKSHDRGLCVTHLVHPQICWGLDYAA